MFHLKWNIFGWFFFGDLVENNFIHYMWTFIENGKIIKFKYLIKPFNCWKKGLGVINEGKISSSGNLKI